MRISDWSSDVCSSDLVDALQELATLESDLRRAMAEGEIVIMFQPQVDIGSGAITGVEALTRWLHPRLGTLSAETVLQVAERAEIFPLLSGHIWEKTLQKNGRASCRERVCKYV